MACSRTGRSSPPGSWTTSPSTSTAATSSTGYKKFKEIILDGVELNPECLVAEDIFWHETEYRSNFNVKPVAMHHKAGPQA